MPGVPWTLLAACRSCARFRDLFLEVTVKHSHQCLILYQRTSQLMATQENSFVSRPVTGQNWVAQKGFEPLRKRRSPRFSISRCFPKWLFSVRFAHERQTC